MLTYDNEIVCEKDSASHSASLYGTFPVFVVSPFTYYIICCIVFVWCIAQ